jgi:hypothetical protein
LRAEIGGMPRILNNSLTYYSFGLSVSLSTSILHIKSYMRENVSLLIKDKIELPERLVKSCWYYFQGNIESFRSCHFGFKN